MRERMRDESGTTMAETLITLALVGVVMTMFLVALESMQTGVVRAEGRSARNDEVRLALAQMDREIRSGNVLYDPALETPDLANDIVPSMTMRIYTQSNAPTRNPGNQCVQWRISGGTLQTRMWADDPNPPATAWRTVARDIVNRDLPTPVPAFALDPSYYKRVIQITIVVDRPDDAAEPQETRLSITGRNTHYAQQPITGPNAVCGNVPAYA